MFRKRTRPIRFHVAIVLRGHKGAVVTLPALPVVLIVNLPLYVMFGATSVRVCSSDKDQEKRPLQNRVSESNLKMRWAYSVAGAHRG